MSDEPFDDKSKTDKNKLGEHKSILFSSDVKPSSELTRERTDSGSSQGSSDTELDSGKVSSIVVNNTVIIDENKNIAINFILNAEQRPDTNLSGGSQGDHTTSYVTILQAMLSATHEFGIKLAIETIESFAGQIFIDDEGAKKELKNISKPEVHEKALRKKLISLLEKNPTEFPKEKIELIKFELKYAKVKQLSDYLCTIADKILRLLQLQEFSSFFSMGRSDKQASEGANAKSASQALFALDTLCKVSQQKDAKLKNSIDHLLKGVTLKRKQDKDISDHVIRYGFNALSRKIVTAKDTKNFVDKFLEDLTRESVTDYNKSKEKINDFLKNLSSSDIIKIIVGFMGDLFDYKRELMFNINNTKLLKKDDMDDFKKRILKEFNDKATCDILSDNQTAKIIRTDIPTLIAIIKRHIMITETAFPQLIKSLKNTKNESGSKTLYEELISLFLSECVLKIQGWDKAKYFDRIEAKENFLTQDYLFKMLNESKPIPKLTDKTTSSYYTKT